MLHRVLPGGEGDGSENNRTVQCTKLRTKTVAQQSVTLVLFVFVLTDSRTGCIN